MKNLILAFLFLLTGIRLTAQKLWVGLAVGEEGQDFRWSIAGNSAGQDPNIYSELKWRGVSGPAGRAEIEWKPGGRWRVTTCGSRVFTQLGTLTDTDYGLDNRFDPVYHQQFAVRGGYSEAASVAVGYSLLSGGRWQLTPFLGYGADRQYFPITDAGGPFGGLQSSYTAEWLGPLVGADCRLHLNSRWELLADVGYHQIHYHATADWNLIPEFAHPVSFRHTADGYGIEAEAGLTRLIGSRMRIGVRGGYFSWQTGTGIDQLYLSAGGSDQTQLNGVVRNGWRAVLAAEVGLF